MPIDSARSSDPKYWAVVPAAGVGKRMGASVPKQYLPLAGKTVIEVTLERLLTHPRVSGIMVAVSVDDGWWNDCSLSTHEKIMTVHGGAERCHSVLNALQALSTTADENDRVLVHDAARPCVRHEDMSQLITQVGLSQDGGLLGVPVKDTMKKTDSRDVIVETLDRSCMWHAFTPQLFPLGILQTSLQSALDKNQLVTDEASAMEMAGCHPLMVEGNSDNLKITRPEDLALAAYYLQHQGS